MSDDVIEMIEKARGEFLHHDADWNAFVDPFDAERLALSKCVEFVDTASLDDMTAQEFVNRMLDIREAALAANGAGSRPTERSPLIANVVSSTDRIQNHYISRARLSARSQHKAASRASEKAQRAAAKKVSGDDYSFGKCVLDYAATQIRSSGAFAWH